jgi:cytochrome bd-type quinol oxidase subunit 2
VIGAALVSAYCLLGAGWLIIKSEGELQLQAGALGAEPACSSPWPVLPQFQLPRRW